MVLVRELYRMKKDVNERIEEIILWQFGYILRNGEEYDC